MAAWRELRRHDALVAIVLCLGAEVEVALAHGAAVSYLAAAVATLPLVWRRRAPLAPAASILAAVLLDRAAGGTWDQPLALVCAVLIASYSAAAYLPLPAAVAGGLLAVSAWGLNTLWWTSEPDSVDAFAVLIAVPWVAGRFVRPLRHEAAEHDALAALLERRHEASMRLAVAEERARLAREIHDAIAHAVSAMVVQAAAAESLIGNASADVLRALRAVQETGRDAIAELRGVLRVLRADLPPAPVAADPLPRPPRRGIRLPWPPWLDVVLALAVFAAAGREVLDHYDTYYAYRELPLPGVLLVAAATLPLAVRRRFPIAVLVTTTAAALAEELIDYPSWESPAVLLVAPAIAAFTVGLAHPPRRAFTAVIATALALGAVESLRVDEGLAWWLFASTWVFGLLALCGQAIRRHRERAEAARLAARRLEQERDALARLAVIEERTRMARELHDAIAHGVSVMVLQAGAAEQVLDSLPAEAREAVRAVQDTGREVLLELGELVGLLRTDEADASPRAPEPTLARLDVLLSDVRDVGLPVRLRVDGEPAALAAGVDSSAYRVIQEALTNTLKHAGPVPTEVVLRYGPETISVEIRSGAPSRPGEPASTGGHGLIGMRERVELYGGELHAGPEPAGGYTVRAQLPAGGEAA